MIIFCAAYPITASSLSSFPSAPLQSLLLRIMLNRNGYIFIHPDPKSKFYVIYIGLVLFEVLHQNSDLANEQRTDASKQRLCLVTDPSFTVTLPWALLAGTRANMAFCYRPYQRNRPVLFSLSLHPLLPSSFWVLCSIFSLLVESFFKGSASSWDPLVFSICVLVHIGFPQMTYSSVLGSSYFFLFF